MRTLAPLLVEARELQHEAPRVPAGADAEMHVPGLVGVQERPLQIVAVPIQVPIQVPRRVGWVLLGSRSTRRCWPSSARSPDCARC